jgi:hypothetical protein
MAYEPKTISSGARGETGLALVAISKDGRTVAVTFKEGNRTVKLSKDDCPDNVRPGKWIVTLNENEDTLYNFRPVQGHFVVKVKEFASAENEAPKPRTKDVAFEKDGKTHSYSYEYWVAVLSIQSPEDMNDLELSYFLRYHFGEVMEDGKSLVAYTKPGSKYTGYLQEFLNASGAWELGPIEYSDNILPELQKRILHADKKFEVTVKDGWIVPGTLLSLDEPDETDLPWEDDENQPDETVVDDEIPIWSDED